MTTNVVCSVADVRRLFRQTVDNFGRLNILVNNTSVFCQPSTGWGSRGGSEFIGKTVGIAGEHLTGVEMAAALTKALGQEVRYNAVPPDVYRGFGFPGADDLGNMFQFKRDFEQYYCGARNSEFARRLNPGLQNFETWLAQNKSRIPLE